MPGAEAAEPRGSHSWIPSSGEPYRISRFLPVHILLFQPQQPNKGSPSVGPLGSFAKYVEWVLMSCDSLFTIDLTEEEVTSPVPNPEPRLP